MMPALCWKYFEKVAPPIVPSGAHGKRKHRLKCQLCNESLIYCKTTSSMWKHLKAKHNSQYQEISRQNESRGSNSQASLEELVIDNAYSAETVPASGGEDGEPTYVAITLHEGDEASHTFVQANTHESGAIQIEPDEPSDHPSGESLHASSASQNVRFMTDVVPSTLTGSFVNGSPFSRKSNQTTSSIKGAPNCMLKRKMAEYCQLEHKAKMEVYRIQRETEEIKKQLANAKLQYVNEQREYLATKRQLLELTQDDIKSSP